MDPGVCRPVSYGDEIAAVLKQMEDDKSLSMLQQQALLHLKDNVSLAAKQFHC